MLLGSKYLKANSKTFFFYSNKILALKRILSKQIFKFNQLKIILCIYQLGMVHSLFKYHHMVKKKIDKMKVLTCVDTLHFKQPTFNTAQL